MKNVKSTLVYLGAVIAVAATVVSCQNDAISKPNFIFKSAPSTEVVAKIAGEDILEKDFISGIESDLYEAEMKVYEIKMARLQAMLLEKLMSKDPKKANLTNDEFLDQHIAKNVKVSAKEIESFIQERQIPKEQVNDEIKGRIENFLLVEAKKVAINDWISQKTKKDPVEVYIKKPSLPVFDVAVGEAPTKGSVKAKVTIVEFSDFQCPFCSKGADVLNQIEKKYGNKVSIAFKHYPLPFHAQAKGAAEASMCAHEQSPKQFWKIHDVMFADQAKLDQTNLVASAKKLGLKEQDFKNCLESGKFKAFVESDIAQGQELGIKSTPTFFINGKLVAGAQPIEVFSEIIDEELAK